MTRARLDPAARVGAATIVALGAVGILAPWLAPLDPLAQTDILLTRLLPPLTTDPLGRFHLLGTDALGRDVLSRMIFGARISLSVGIFAVAVSVAIGSAVGLAAGLLGTRIDRLLMGLTDAMLALPRLVLLLALVALFEPSLTLVILALGTTGWMSIARLMRAEVHRVRHASFVEAARASGTPPGVLVTSHVLPNAVTPVIVAAALAVGNAITLESGLAFLGLGVPVPAPSWGNMIAEGREVLINAPWIAILPGAAIAVVVLATNLVGDGLRDRLDPTAPPES